MRPYTIGIAVLAAVAAGCGSKDTSNATSGADVFTTAGCPNCHTLAAAGANGRVGPDLDRLKPDVLVAVTTNAVQAAKHATTTIPIVFMGVTDPVTTGLVDSLAQPGATSRESRTWPRS